MDKKNLTTAYGIITSIINFGAFCGTLLTGTIINTSLEGGNFRFLNFVQMVELTISFGFCVMLWRYDLFIGHGILSASSEEANKLYIEKIFILGKHNFWRQIQKIN